MKHTKKTAVILAGGKNERMQQKPKALLFYKGTTIIETIIKAVSCFDEILIVSNEPKLYERFGYRVVEDLYKGKGPMAGIHAGLVHASYDRVLVIACDMPELTGEMAELMYQYEETYDALVSFDGKETHPLFSMYHKNCLPVIEKHLNEDKLKLKWFLEEIKTVLMDWCDALEIENAQSLFKNINTPSDYRELLWKLHKSNFSL